MTDDTIKSLIAKTWKSETADLAPGKHFIDEEFTIRVNGTVTKREAGTKLMSPSGETMAVRNSIEEMCPSPVARRLMMNRRLPGGTFD